MKRKTKTGLKTIGYGAAGNVAATTIAIGTGHGSPRGLAAANAIGSGAGLAFGGWRASKQVDSTEPAKGSRAYKRRVGTKKQGRVGKKDHPYNVK